MIKDLGYEAHHEEARAGSCLMWFIWGITMSLTTICSLALLIMLVGSLSLNAYLAWQLSGYEVVVRRPEPVATEIPPPAAPALVEVPTSTPEPAETAPVSTTVPVPTESLLDTQVSTLAAIATSAAPAGSTGTPTPISTLEAAIPIGPEVPAAEADEGSTGETQPIAPAGEASAGAVSTVESAAADASGFAAPVTASTNSYELFPIEGERESRPAEEHGDLNLKLRDPQPIEVELSLVDVGAGVDPDAPSFSSVFEPKFKAAYTIHDWDWGCNCKGPLTQDKGAVLVGIETTPGQPIFIPKKKQDIYDGRIYATVLYASEDSLTFVYARAGSVVKGYTVHYLGLQTDPNLVALFRKSQGNQLPGLTLDTPVGVATDELIVAIRDNGKFLDARSINDWWK